MTAHRESPSLDELRRKLHPGRIRANLIRAGLFLAGWEMLADEVQDKVRDFFSAGVNEDRVLIYSKDYEAKVLALHKSRFEASLLWLIDAGALTEHEVECIRRLRAYRNEVAHELPKMLLEPGHDVDVARIREMKELVAVLGRFWGRIEIDIDPAFDGKHIDDSQIESGWMSFMEHLVAVAEETEVPQFP